MEESGSVDGVPFETYLVIIYKYLLMTIVCSQQLYCDNNTVIVLWLVVGLYFLTCLIFFHVV